MKKIIISICLVLTIFLVTACFKDKSIHTCTTKNVTKTDPADGKNYIMDTNIIAKLDDKGKLINYKIVNSYHYETEEYCNTKCESYKNRYSSKMNQNYSGLTDTVDCSCKGKYINITNDYNIEKLDTLRSDIPNLNKDNTFELETWLNKYKSIGYECN